MAERLESQADGGSIEAWSTSIARILTPDEAIVGAGFLVSDDHVLTCAHVVAQVLGTSAEQAEPPSGDVLVDFPKVAPGRTVTAHVVRWRPVHPSPGLPTASAEDIPVLKLSSRPPEGSRWAQWLPSDSLSRRTVN